MMTKCVTFFVLAFVATSVSAGVIPVASYAVAPIASSYSSHVVNHAVASPIVSAPLVAAHAPVVAAHAPLVAAHAPVVAAHAPLAAYSAYSAYPYSAYPYSAYPYASYLG